MKTFIYLWILCWSGTAWAQSDWFPKGEARGHLQRAHEFYLQGQQERMVDSLKAVLLDPEVNHAEKNNALGLLERAYQIGHGLVRASWSLPRGVDRLHVTQVRKEEPEHLYFRLTMGAHLAEEDLVHQVRLVAPGGEVIFDRESGVGEWQVDKEDGGKFSFELSSEDRSVPWESGLYRLYIRCKDGTSVNGWFIMSNQLASSAPKIHSPKVGARYEGVPSQPVIRWDDYRSPEFQDFERRSLVILVAQLHQPDFQIRWMRFAFAPEEEEAKIDRPLDRGDYWLSMTFREERRFGPVRLRRASRTARRFYVR